MDAGACRWARRRDVTFQVGNSGTVALIITRALAPSGEFSTDVPMPEGTTVDPGTFLDQPVTFQPTAPGPDSETYTFKSERWRPGHGHARRHRHLITRDRGAIDPGARTWATMVGCSHG